MRKSHVQALSKLKSPCPSDCTVLQKMVCNRNIALPLAPLAFSENNLVVKRSTENSAPFLKVAALNELKIDDLPIVSGDLISQTSCLDGQSFQIASTRMQRFLLPACEHQARMLQLRHPAVLVGVSCTTMQMHFPHLTKNANRRKL